MQRFLMFITVFLLLGLVGQVDAAGLFGAKLPPLPAGQTKKAQAQEEEFVDEGDPKDFVDPQEIQNEIRQTNDQLREIKRLFGSVKRAKSQQDIDALTELQKLVLGFQKQIKALKPDSEGARDVLQEYRDSGIWDSFNEIRRRVELPKELSDIKKSLGRVEKLLTAKQVQKAFTELGGDMESVKGVVATMRASYDTAMQAMAGGDTESIDDALMDIREGGHPGELEGMLQGMKDFAMRMRAIRDQEIRDGIKEIAAPIIAALNSGDIREARMVADELGPQIEKIMQKAMRVGKKDRKSFLKKIADLERLMNERMEAQSVKGESKEEKEENGGEE